MIKLSAFKYYLQSTYTIISQMNFWVILSLLWLDQIELKVGEHKFLASSLLEVWSIKEIFIDQDYLRYHSMPKQGQVIDIGASIGDFSILTSPHVDQVFAFDCDASRHKIMKQNLVLNQVENVKLVLEEVKSLEELIKKWGVDQPSFLKVDCEGCEYQILENCSDETLQKIPKMAMELHLFDSKMIQARNQLISRLKKLGFKVKIEPNPVHYEIEFLYVSKTAFDKI